ncbi:CPBP family intramembrane metalloprotease, partial [Leptolyngbya sp. FACHB-36]|nr:CPBP family intramembrane metalloprotease [Leptolyngbya sp. FACHB-36]
MIQTLARRLTNAIRTIPAKRDWVWAIALLLIYGAVFLPIGLASGFLRWHLPSSLWLAIGVLVRALLMPGLSEELFFRVLLIPHPLESVSLTTRGGWIGVSWISFVL